MDRNFSKLVQALPKAELHVHLRGALPEPLLRKLCTQYPATLIQELLLPRHKQFLFQHPHIQNFFNSDDQPDRMQLALMGFHSFEGFLASYLLSAYLFQSQADFGELLSAVMDALAQQNIVYAEITVSPNQYLYFDLELSHVLSALGSASHPDVEVNWIYDPVRDRGPEQCVTDLKHILALDPEVFTGITLGGSEHLFPPELFMDLYQLAQEAGLQCSIHAGESLGSPSVARAVQDLNVQRVGHGIGAIDNRALCKQLASSNIALELCVAGNLLTNCIASLAEHPARALYDSGIPLTINTDDPAFFNTSLLNECSLFFQMGFSEDEVISLLRNGFEYAFLGQHKKHSYLSRFDHAVASLQTKASAGSSS